MERGNEGKEDEKRNQDCYVHVWTPHKEHRPHVTQTCTNKK